MSDAFTTFSGSANPALAQAILHELGADRGAYRLGRFPDSEVAVEILESVRGKEVFLIQPTAPPVNDTLIELLALADACRRDGATSVAAIVPYFGYGRADKRHNRQEPIMARVVADLMQAVGIDWIVTVDMHAPQIEGFFHVPVDNLTAVPTLCEALRDHIPADVVVVAPDAGRVEMATRYAEQCLGAPVVVVHKQRVSGSETKVTRIVGEVAGRACLIIDDMISTGGTIAETTEALLASGARPEIIVAATHGLFVGRAREKLSHPAIRAVFVTDTVNAPEAAWPQLRVISIASLIAASMRQFLSGSLSHPERTVRASLT